MNLKNAVSLLLFLILLQISEAKAQSVSMAVVGDGCIGSNYDFQFNTCVGCTFINWEITGDYTIESDASGVIVLHWNEPGTFQVKASYSLNSQSLTTSPISVTIYAPTVSITGPTGSTPGSTVSYTCTTMNTYNWSVSGGTLINGQGTNAITVHWATAGSKFVSVSGGSGFCPSYVQLNVNVSSIPIPEILPVTDITSGTFKANWSNISEATSYHLEVATDQEFSSSSFLPGYNPKIVTGTSELLSGLDNLTYYYFRVRAITSIGSSNYSDVQSVRTDPAETYLYTGISEITPSSFKVEYGMINLPGNWTFQFQVSLQDDFSTILDEITVTGNTGQWSVTGLNQSTIYNLRTRVLFTNGTWSPFDVRDPITTYSIPPAPLLHSGHNYFSETTFMALWNAIPEATHYQLDVAYDEQFTDFVEGYQNRLITGVACCGDDRLWYEVKGLEGGTIYYHRIRAVNSHSIFSSYSNTAALTTRWPSVNHQRKNMIITRTALVELDDQDIISSPTPGNVQINVGYFDGLGRPLQNVNWKASPSGYDVITPNAYDPFGRIETQYLPYVATTVNGFYSNTAIPDQQQFYQSEFSDNNGYAKTVFEPSPLNRVLKQGAPGTAWQPDEANPTALNDHSVKMRYETNGVNDVLLLEYDETAEVLDLDNGLTYYDPNELYANKTFDEHNNEVIEYVDKEGRTVLKRVQYDEKSGTKLYAETYYVYDDFGNLVMVLPPEGVKQLVSLLNQN